MADYKTKLYVSVETPDEGLQLLSPIRDINITVNTPHTQIHSLESDNKGVSKGNDTYAFSMTVDALRDEVEGINPSKVITKLQLKHTKFKIIVVERDTLAANGEKNWGFNEWLLEGCYLNTGAPTRLTIGGTPTATFNGIALGVNVDGEFYNGTLPV